MKRVRLIIVLCAMLTAVCRAQQTGSALAGARTGNSTSGIRATSGASKAVSDPNSETRSFALSHASRKTGRLSLPPALLRVRLLALSRCPSARAFRSGTSRA